MAETHRPLPIPHQKASAPRNPSSSHKSAGSRIPGQGRDPRRGRRLGVERWCPCPLSGDQEAASAGANKRRRQRVTPGVAEGPNRGRAWLGSARSPSAPDPVRVGPSRRAPCLAPAPPLLLRAQFAPSRRARGHRTLTAPPRPQGLFSLYFSPSCVGWISPLAAASDSLASQSSPTTSCPAFPRRVTQFWLSKPGLRLTAWELPRRCVLLCCLLPGLRVPSLRRSSLSNLEADFQPRLPAPPRQLRRRL